MFHRYPSADSDPNIIAAAVAEQIAHCIRIYQRDPAEMTVRPSAVAWRGCFTKTDVRLFADRLALGESEETDASERFGFGHLRHSSGEVRFKPRPDAWKSETAPAA